MRAVDPAENADPTPAEHTWEVVGPATTTILTGPPREPLANTKETSATFTWTANQAELIFGCSLDGAQPVACTSPHTVHGLTVGAHSFEVTSRNSFLIVEPESASNTWLWTIDEPNPNTPAGTDVAVDIPTAAGLATVTFGSVATAGHTTVTLLETPPSELPQGYLIAGSAYYDIVTTAEFAPGDVRVCLAFNPANVEPPVALLHYDETLGAWVDISDTTTGNVVCGEAGSLSPFALATESSAALLDTFVDIAPPSQTVSQIATFSFSSNDGEASFECMLDGVPFTSCSTTTEYTDLAVGQHELFVRAKNGAGEVDLTPAVHRWTIGPLPDTAILSGPEEVTEDRDAHFQFISTLAGATFECSLDEMAENLLFLPCDANHTFSNLAFGDHELLVRAKDNAGNVDPTPAEYGWEIGGIPPLVLIESGPDAESTSRDATFTFSADTTERIFLCSLDGAEPSPCQSPHSYTGLPLGAHTFEVQVYVDPEFAVAEAPVSRYEWTVVGLTAPETSIVFGPPPVSGGMDPEGGQATFIFAFSSNSTQALFECALDGGAWSSCESPMEYSGIALGDHLFRVRAHDLSVPPNYDPTPATHAFRVVPAPETTIVSGPEGEVNGTTATFTFSSTVAGSTFECALDLGPFVACANPYTLTNVPDGEHMLEVRAKTADGVVDTTPEEWSWAVNGQLPDTTILTGPPSFTTSTGAVFTFSSTEGLVEYECSLDGGLFEGCEPGEPPLPESSHIAIELMPGEHTLRVRAVDETGFFDPTPASWTWTIVMPPDTAIVNAPAHDTTDANATFTFTASQPGSTFQCSLNSDAEEAYEPCATPTTYEGLVPGLYVFRVRSVTPGGIVDPSPAAHAWRVRAPSETEAPDTTLTATPPASTTNTSATFRFTASELGVSYQCSLDGAPFSNCNSGIVLNNLAVGEHTFQVRAIDAFDNVETEPASYTWLVVTGDGTPPIAIITNAPPNNDPISNDVALFEFEANEPATFVCSLDGAPYAPCTSPIEYLNLSPMLHQFRVKATDQFGNVGVATMYEWETLDVTPPDTELLSWPSDPSGSSTARFEFAGTDNVTVIEGEVQLLEFECRLNEGAWFTCVSPANLINIQPGLTTFEVRAMDSEGNVDPSPAGYAWTVLDGTPPQTTLTSTPPASTMDTSASFEFSSSEAGSTFACSLDGADFAACDSGIAYSDLIVGSHWFRVAATDSSGLVDDSPASYTWTILPPPDTTDPQTFVDQGPASSTLSSSASLFFSADEPANFQCSFNGGSFNQCASPFQLTNLGVGSYTFQVFAIDLSGNVDDTPASHAWTVIPQCRHDDHRVAGRPDRRDVRDLRVRGRPGRRELRVRARRRHRHRHVDRVRLGRHVHRPRAGRARVRRPREGRPGERRSDARGLRLGDRHDHAARHHDHRRPRRCHRRNGRERVERHLHLQRRPAARVRHVLPVHARRRRSARLLVAVHRRRRRPLRGDRHPGGRALARGHGPRPAPPRRSGARALRVDDPRHDRAGHDHRDGRSRSHPGRPRAAARHHLRLERGERDLRVLAQRRGLRRVRRPADERLRGQPRAGHVHPRGRRGRRERQRQRRPVARERHVHRRRRAGHDHRPRLGADQPDHRADRDLRVRRRPDRRHHLHLLARRGRLHALLLAGDVQRGRPDGRVDRERGQPRHGTRRPLVPRHRDQRLRPPGGDARAPRVDDRAACSTPSTRRPRSRARRRRSSACRRRSSSPAPTTRRSRPTSPSSARSTERRPCPAARRTSSSTSRSASTR